MLQEDGAYVAFFWGDGQGIKNSGLADQMRGNRMATSISVKNDSGFGCCRQSIQKCCRAKDRRGFDILYDKM